MLLTQPYLLSLHPDREMHVLILTDIPEMAQVEYGNTPALGKRIPCTRYKVEGIRAPRQEGGYAETPEDNPLMEVWQYIAVIDHLTAGERVYYRCIVGEACTQTYDFRSAPPAGEDYRFALISDLQCMEPCAQTVKRIGLTHPDFMLYAGDTVLNTWRADQWFDLHSPLQSAQDRKNAFFPCLQQQDGARLMQYAPMFLCPGNHDMDDFRVNSSKEYAADPARWTYTTYMQLFRPLYPEAEYGFTGKRWYSANYADMHIVSLQVARCAFWPPQEWPGWVLAGDISQGSPQIRWLQQDLQAKKTAYTWVFLHWHLYNRGSDVQVPLVSPEADESGRMTYPRDDGQQVLMPLFERYGVNAVNYGHSHVYERYFVRGIHYIEAAYMSKCYREKDAKPHPSGEVSILEDNSCRSFLLVERRADGLYATAHRAEGEAGIFDAWKLA